MSARGSYHGLPTRILSNAHLRLECLAEAGPRIVSLKVAGSEKNLMAEVPDIKVATPYGDYFLVGGHRLWHAPEGFPRSYIPDNNGLLIEDLPDGLRLCQPTEVATGIRKSIELHLHDERPAVTLCHRLQNDNLWPVELAPWAITQMRPGGLAVLPQRAGSSSHAGLLPDRQLVVWPYTHWRESRLHFQDDYVFVEAQSQVRPCKVGHLNRQGWIGYLGQGVFFLKRFQPQVDKPHPDMGCNAEVYSIDRFIELETVAPLCWLEPGESVTHDETWELYTAADVPQTAEGVSRLVSLLEL